MRDLAGSLYGVPRQDTTLLIDWDWVSCDGLAFLPGGVEVFSVTLLMLHEAGYAPVTDDHKGCNT